MHCTYLIVLYLIVPNFTLNDLGSEEAVDGRLRARARRADAPQAPAAPARPGAARPRDADGGAAQGGDCGGEGVHRGLRGAHDVGHVQGRERRGKRRGGADAVAGG